VGLSNSVPSLMLATSRAVQTKIVSNNEGGFLVLS
jgi:hypothetical protein